MAGVALHRALAFVAEEPTGFVFEEASVERENSLRAAALLAAAGAPVLVLDGADNVKVGQGGCWCLFGGRVDNFLVVKGDSGFGNGRNRTERKNRMNSHNISRFVLYWNRR